MDPSPEVSSSTPKTASEKPIKVGKKSTHHAGRKVSSDSQNSTGEATSSIGKSSFSKRDYVADNTIRRRDIQVLTSEEAAKLLHNGTFVVRKSVSSPGQYSATWKTLDGKVVQKQLNSANLDTINKDIKIIVETNGVKKYQFPTPVRNQEVKLITSAFPHADLTPKSGVRNFIKLDPKAAESMLPLNSYLVRASSSNPNLLTITIKDNEGRCIHQRVNSASLSRIHELPDLKNKKEITQIEIQKLIIHNFKPYKFEFAESEFKENIFNKDKDLYCVRESPSNPDKYVLSVKNENGIIVHYDLESTDFKNVNKEVSCINKCVNLDYLKSKIINLLPEIDSVNSKEEALNYLFNAVEIYQSVVDIGNPFYSLRSNESAFDAKYSSAAFEMREFTTEFKKGVSDLVRLYMGSDVNIPSQNEIIFWKLSEHKGVKTHNEMRKLIPAAGDWAIYYNQYTKTNMLIVNCAVTFGEKNPLYEIDKTPLNINPDLFREDILRREDTIKILEEKLKNLRQNVAGG